MVRRALCVASLIAIACPATAQIGKIKSTIGVASVERTAKPIAASVGQDLMPGDRLVTGKDGKIGLTFVDNTRFSVGPDSRIALSKFEYDPTTEQGSFIAEVERGTIAVVSGRIAKTRCGAKPPEAQPTCGGGMEVRTPETTLAVRGTRFIVTVRK